MEAQTETICPRQRDEATMEVQRRHVARWRGDGTCSYCGSMSEAGFFAAIEAGQEIVPTEKDYKAYVQSAPGDGRGKFYFQHLSIDGRKKLVELINAKAIRFAYPGRFYVLPFFVVVENRARGDGQVN